MKISDYKTAEMNINDTIAIVTNPTENRNASMRDIFNWIAEEARKDGLTVKLTDDGNMMFIKGDKTKDK